MSFDACAKLVAKADPDRFATAMCAPMPGRAALMALYAFNVEVTRAAWVTEEPLIAEMRLQWWKDALDEIYAGRQTRAHDIVAPLTSVIRDHDLPRPLFDALVDARRFDIYPDGHDGPAAFDAYVAHTSGNLMELAGRGLGSAVAEPYQSVGWATGIAAVLRASPELYRRGRHPLPFGPIDRNALAEGRLSSEQAGVVRALVRQANARLADGLKVRAHPGSEAALLPSWDARRILTMVGQSADHLLTLSLAPSRLRRAVALMVLSSFGRW